MKSIAIIGGGAAGLMSAISAKRQNSGTHVTIYESNSRVGKKLLTTGNGRCNITNRHLDLTHFHSHQIDRVDDALNQFSLDASVAFFQSIHIPLKDDGNDKLYPASFQAQSVVDALRFECGRLGVEIISDTKIESLTKRGDKFVLNGTFSADKVIIACGGKSAPKTGSDGSGYRLLKEFGHTCVKTFPSIVPIKTETDSIKAAKGIKADVNLTVESKHNHVSAFGEILFTDYGISGPVAIQLSRFVPEHNDCHARINFLPHMYKEEILYEVKQRASSCYENSVENLLLGLINKRIGFAILKKSGIGINSRADALTDLQVKTIADNLSDFLLDVRGVCGFEVAQATAGGISLNEFNADMQSKKCEGLYACGEILDVDGDCGGFNLQWAWTSGFIAGSEAAKCL